MTSKYNVITPHTYCSYNYESISLSKNCICIYCKQTFPKDAVLDWLDDGKTATCPFCGVDTVIGDSTKAPITDSEFIEAMHTHWFS